MSEEIKKETAEETVETVEAEKETTSKEEKKKAKKEKKDKNAEKLKEMQEALDKEKEARMRLAAEYDNLQHATVSALNIRQLQVSVTSFTLMTTTATRSPLSQVSLKEFR